MATSAAYIDLDEGAAPATPGTGKIRVYAKTDGSAYQKDDAGTETGLAGGGGDVATDAIFDAKGDLAGGTGANTAARLAVGANDTVLTADSAEATGMKWAVAAGGGIDSGTSLPGSPSDNDLFFHETDKEFYYYDNSLSLWLSVSRYRIDMPEPNATAGATSIGSTIHRVAGPLGVDSFRVEEIKAGIRPQATNNGSHYWTVTYKRVTGGTATDIGTFNTSGDTAGMWVTKTTTINATVTSGHENFIATAVATGSPGVLNHAAVIYYRRVAS